MDRILTIVACVVALAALMLSLRRDETPVVPDGTSTELQQQLMRLEGRLAALADRQHRLAEIVAMQQTAQAHTDFASTETDRKDTSVDGITAGLKPMVAELERKQVLLEQDLVELGVFEHFEALQEEIAASYAAALNPELSAKERVGALPALRRSNRVDADVVNSMLELWDEQDDAYVRYFVMENLEGVTDTTLRDHILSALPEEESPKLRGRAIQTLAPMMPDPHIEEWLAYLEENDPSPWVREQAAEVHRRSTSSKSSPE